MAEREAACQLCDFLKHLVRDEVAQLEIRQVLRFAAQPPMHFRTMPLDPGQIIVCLEMLTSRPI